MRQVPARKKTTTGTTTGRSRKTTTPPSGNGHGEETGLTTRPRAPSASSRGGGQTLVIVESPAKAKTINKYLGGNYKVLASYGHVRDLPRRRKKGEQVAGIDIDA